MFPEEEPPIWKAGFVASPVALFKPTWRFAFRLLLDTPIPTPVESITTLSVPPVSNLILSSSLDSSTWILVSASASLKILAVVLLVVVNVIDSTFAPLGGASENVNVFPDIE